MKHEHLKAKYMMQITADINKFVSNSPFIYDVENHAKKLALEYFPNADSVLVTSCQLYATSLANQHFHMQNFCDVIAKHIKYHKVKN